MGYRYQVMSGVLEITEEELPHWFKLKYSGIIDFDREFWASTCEFKRYVTLSDFNKDIQKVLIELNLPDESIKLIYFADEGCEESPDISHVYITIDEITEILAAVWEAFDQE